MARVGWWQWLLRGVLLCLLSSTALAADESGDETEAPAAELKVANRTILVLRATLLGESPEIRAARARAVINEVLEVDSSELKVSLQPVQGSIMVRLGDRRAFIVSPGDVDPVQHDSVEAAANAAAQVLHQVVSESEESRNLRFMLVAVVYSVAATVVFLLLIRLIYFVRGKVLGALPGVMQRHAKALKLGSTQVVDAYQLYPVVSRVLHVVRWLIVLLLTYEWLSFVLSRFPYTRPWGESLNSYLVELARYLFDGIVSAVPGLGVAVAIFFIARGLSAVCPASAQTHGCAWRQRCVVESGNPGSDAASFGTGGLVVCIGHGLSLPARCGYRGIQGAVGVAWPDGVAGRFQCDWSGRFRADFDLHPHVATGRVCADR